MLTLAGMSPLVRVIIQRLLKVICSRDDARPVFPAADLWRLLVERDMLNSVTCVGETLLSFDAYSEATARDPIAATSSD